MCGSQIHYFCRPGEEANPKRCPLGDLSLQHGCWWQYVKVCKGRLNGLHSNIFYLTFLYPLYWPGLIVSPSVLHHCPYTEVQQALWRRSSAVRPDNRCVKSFECKLKTPRSSPFTSFNVHTQAWII